MSFIVRKCSALATLRAVTARQHIFSVIVEAVAVAEVIGLFY